MKTSDFDYTLPPELIAQTPIEPRDGSRLLVLDRKDGSIQHRHFREILEFLHEGDVLVFNDSRVIPARLRGRRDGSGGRVEILLLRQVEDGEWEALVKPARKLLEGAVVRIPVAAGAEEITAEITGLGEAGLRRVRFSDESRLMDAGEVALPPYIHEHLADPERYQTVYSRLAGSVAAPTAGLHFTKGLLRDIERKGIKPLFVTLHIGLDTFRPITEEDPEQHRIHREYGVLSTEVASEISRARREKRRVIAIGTTPVRILEQAALLSQNGEIQPFRDWVELFILPGHRFQAVDAMVTNFHLPRSTLLMLVAAFGGTDLVKRAYSEAIAQHYRFYSFGDAMLVL